MSDSDTTQPIQSSPRPKWIIHVSFEGSEAVEQAMKDAGFSSGDLRKDAQDFAESAFALLVWMIGELKKVTQSLQ